MMQKKALCDIHKDVTFHIARHTFATTVTLENGVPIESVSKMPESEYRAHKAKKLRKELQEFALANGALMN